MRTIVFAAVFCLAATTAFAADLCNRDSHEWGIEIQTGSTTHTSINSNTTQSGGAPKGATIRVKETGSTFTVSEDKTVYIKDGQLYQE